jgi:hypothetical protein
LSNNFINNYCASARARQGNESRLFAQIIKLNENQGRGMLSRQPASQPAGGYTERTRGRNESELSQLLQQQIKGLTMHSYKLKHSLATAALMAYWRGRERREKESTHSFHARQKSAQVPARCGVIVLQINRA